MCVHCRIVSCRTTEIFHVRYLQFHMTCSIGLVVVKITCCYFDNYRTGPQCFEQIAINM